MSFLRFVGLVALALWLGGLATLGLLAAPLLFDVLVALEPSSGRQLAGAAFGAIFDRFQHASWIAGAVLLLSLGGRAALGPRPRGWGIRTWIAAGMLAASLGSALFVTPHIERLRAAAPAGVTALAPDDPRRAEFGRWHAISSGLMALTLVAGVGLLWMEASDRH